MRKRAKHQIPNSDERRKQQKLYLRIQRRDPDQTPVQSKADGKSERRDEYKVWIERNKGKTSEVHNYVRKALEEHDTENNNLR